MKLNPDHPNFNFPDGHEFWGLCQDNDGADSLNVNQIYKIKVIDNSYHKGSAKILNEIFSGEGTFYLPRFLPLTEDVINSELFKLVFEGKLHEKS